MNFKPPTKMESLQKDLALLNEQARRITAEAMLNQKLTGDTKAAIAEEQAVLDEAQREETNAAPVPPTIPRVHK